jgi:uncharacterized protein
VELVTPGVSFERVRPGPRRIGPLRTDVAAFVGVAERGPVGAPVAAGSWEEFAGIFGGFVGWGLLAYSVKAFFENGGRRCHVVRVATRSRSTRTRGAAAQPPDGASSLVESVDGFAPGAAVTVRAGADAATVGLGRVDTGNRALVWERPLDAAFRGRDLELATGAHAAAAWIDADGVRLRLEASSPGAWGSGLRVAATRTVPSATRTAGPQPDDRAASAVESVAGFAPGTLVRLSQTGAAPADPFRVVTAVDPWRRRLTWDAPLDPAFNRLRPLRMEAVELGLTVWLGGTLRETFAGLSLVPRHERWAPLVLARESRLVRAAPAGAGAPPAVRVPATVTLFGGRDGVAALAAGDFTGLPWDAAPRGLQALDAIDEVSLVAIPDVLAEPRPAAQRAPLPAPPVDPCLPPAEPEPPAAMPPAVLSEAMPAFALDNVAAVQAALVAHCEARRDRVALLDPPAPGGGASAAAALAEVEAWRRRFDSRFAALYFPWLLVYDPLRLDGRLVRAVPPSGHVAGVIARCDLAVGVHQPPANQELRWAQALATDVTEEAQGLLNPLGVNCVRAFPGRGLRVYGARTVSSDRAWRYLNVRRLVSMIEEAVEEALQWAVFEPADVFLRETIRLGIAGLLAGLWERGALVGATPEEAFFVRCDDETTPPAEAELGRLIAIVGVAPVQPAEFLVFRVGRTQDELEVVED